MARCDALVIFHLKIIKEMCCKQMFWLMVLPKIMTRQINKINCKVNEGKSSLFIQVHDNYCFTVNKDVCHI